VGVLLLFGGFFSAKCGSSVSAKFLIYRTHAVCFLPLVAMFDPLAAALFIKVKNGTSPNHPSTRE
jgi:hypothetical protein